MRSGPGLGVSGRWRVPKDAESHKAFCWLPMWSSSKFQTSGIIKIQHSSGWSRWVLAKNERTRCEYWSLLRQDSLKCGGDVCWEDLGSPLGPLVAGDQLAEVLQWTLSLAALIPPTLYFSRLKLWNSEKIENSIFVISSAIVNISIFQFVKK